MCIFVEYIVSNVSIVLIHENLCENIEETFLAGIFSKSYSLYNTALERQPA